MESEVLNSDKSGRHDALEADGRVDDTGMAKQWRKQPFLPEKAALREASLVAYGLRRTTEAEGVPRRACKLHEKRLARMAPSKVSMDQSATTYMYGHARTIDAVYAVFTSNFNSPVLAVPFPPHCWRIRACINGF